MGGAASWTPREIESIERAGKVIRHRAFDSRRPLDLDCSIFGHLRMPPPPPSLARDRATSATTSWGCPAPFTHVFPPPPPFSRSWYLPTAQFYFQFSNERRSWITERYICVERDMEGWQVPHCACISILDRQVRPPAPGQPRLAFPPHSGGDGALCVRADALEGGGGRGTLNRRW